MPAQTRIIHYYVCLGAAGGKEWKVNMFSFFRKRFSYAELFVRQTDYFPVEDTAKRLLVMIKKRPIFIMHNTY